MNPTLPQPLTLPKDGPLQSAFDEILILSARMREGLVPFTRAASVRVWAIGVLRARRAALLAEGLAEELIDAAQLPVVALLDEAARLSPAQGMREVWSPIQVELYGHEELGQALFSELARLRTLSPPPVEVLSLYLRCLAFGLQGQHQDDVPALQGLTHNLLEDLRRLRPAEEAELPLIRPLHPSPGDGWALSLPQVGLCAAVAATVLMLSGASLLRWESMSVQQAISERGGEDMGVSGEGGR